MHHTKIYEFSNHLGNVLTVISDRKIAVVNAGASVIDHFSSEILSASDFYCFGSEMNARKYSSSSTYRYGFNGKELDLETGTIDFGARAYDARLGRFLSLDKEFAKGPAYSPYNYALNSPLIFNDPDGNWVSLTIIKYYMKDGVLIPKTTFRDLFRRTVKIEKEFVIHDAKIYFADPVLANRTDEWKAIYTKAFQASIVQGNSGSDSKEDKNKQVGSYTDVETGQEIPIYAPKKTIEVKVSFATDIEVINKASQIDGDDNLYIIAGNKEFAKFGRIAAKTSLAHTTKGSNVAIFNNLNTNIASHESLHQLGLEHSSMPADGEPLDYKGLKHMGDSYNNKENVLPSKQILEKIEQKK